MAWVFDAKTGSGGATESDTDGTFTFSHVTGTLTNGILFVWITWSSTATTVSSVTYNGVAMTQAAYATANGRATALYYLVNPSAGTNNVVITFSATAGRVICGAHTWSGANSTQTPQTQSANGTGTTFTVTCGTNSGELIVDCIAAVFSSGDVVAVGANQTERGNRGVGASVGGSSSQDGADGGVMSWTDSVSRAYVTVAASFDPAPTNINGSLSKTQAADSVSSSSKLQIKATATKTQASDSLSSQSDLIVQGSLSKTQAGDSLSSQSKIEIKANLSKAQSDNAISSTGLLALKGITSKSQDDNSLSSAGEIDLVASLNQAQDGNSLSSQSILRIQGALTETQQGDTLSSDGDLRIVGSLSKSQQDQTLHGIGSGLFNPPISGELIAEQDNNTVISSAVLLTHANLNKTQDGNVLVSSGNIKLSSQLSVIQSNNVLTSQSDLFIIGGLSAVQSNNTLLSSIDLVLPIAGPGLAPVIYAESLQKIKGQKSKVIYAEKINDL